MKPIVVGHGADEPGEDLEKVILREGIDLLSNVKISPRDAARLEGDHIVVMVVPTWLNNTLEEFELEVSCYAFSQAHVQWPQVSISAQALSPEAPSAEPVRLARSGSCFLGPLKANVNYRISASFGEVQQDEVAQDLQAFDERLRDKLLKVLSRVRFSAVEGTSTRFEEVEVTIQIRRSGAESSCRIHAACRSTERNIDYQSVGVMIESGSGVAFAPKWFTSAGTVEFRLTADPTEQFSLRTAVSQSTVLVGSVGQLLAHGADRREESSSAHDEFAYKATSSDGHITAIAWREPGGVINIHVETREPALREAIVSVEFWAGGSQMLLQDSLKMDLEKRDNEDNLIYWGAWSGEVTLPTEATMRVAAFPPSTGSEEGSGLRR